MGKVIAIGPGGRAQAPARDDRCRPVIEAVLQLGLLDRKLISPPCRTLTAAEELKSAIYRSCRYYCSCGKIYCTRKHRNYPPDSGCPDGGQRVGAQADAVKKTDPASGKVTWHVQFTIFDKREAMRAVVQRYGPDPNKWPYFARRRELKAR